MIGKKKLPFSTIDEYIALQAKEIQPALQKLREIIRKVAPKAEECISYQMPAFRQNGVLVYFAASKNHIGFYPTSGVLKALAEQIGDYQTSKGTIQFPHGKPIPVKLVKDIVRYRVKEDEAKMKKK